ncbi:MAG: 3-phosphoshikimate 1-carboxyvinyltransferase [Prevotella sp.]|nr:3-phosphoshikimate 1-carboxyvinyltransferase [Prevotella sp.]
MTYQITAPQTLDATITLPASKSISNRALIIQALAGGRMMPANLSDCDDTEVVISALEHDPDTVDIKAAGTAMRFMTAYLSVTEGEHIITGTERMKHRPIGILVDALRNLGADISYMEQEGYPPLRICGRKLPGGRLDVPGNISSQYISALLMVGPSMQNGLELHLTGNIVSRPYIDLTLYLMKQYGADVDWTGVDTITVRPHLYSERAYTIENDWSASSYWYELMTLYEGRDARVTLNGLSDGSQQGDSIVKYIYSLLGIKTSFAQNKKTGSSAVKLSRRMGRVQRLDFDFINCPDLAQTVVVTCCALNIPFHFSGLGSLKIKETDRIEALKTELRKVGYVIRSENDSELFWDGDQCEPTFDPIDTYEDHRMAMAFAPLAVRFGNIRINDPEVVSKSYPHFWEDLRLAGFEITEEEED